MAFELLTLRMFHGGKLQQYPINYKGGIMTEYFDIDVDRFSYFEFVDYVKENGYNCETCDIYVRPPMSSTLVKDLADRDIMGIVHLLKNGDIFEVCVSYFVDEALVVPPAIEYGSEGVGFEEPQKSVPVTDDVSSGYEGGPSNLDDTPLVETDVESSDHSTDSEIEELFEEGEEEYGSDVDEEYRNLREERKKMKLLVLKQILMKLLMMKVKMKSNSQLSFESVRQFREALTKYAVDEHVELDKYVNERTRVRVKCCAGCPCLLFASYDSRTKAFVVTNYNPLHKCNGTTKNKLCNSKYLVERYKDRIIYEPTIRIFKFQELVQKELEVYIGRTVARKTKNIVLTQIMGDHIKEFGRILDYRDKLLRTNPDSTCVVRLSEETHEDGRKMFVAFYICFDVLKKAFLDGCRRCIGFDGYFLKGVCKGQLLVAVCKDGNNQMLPLAWSVVKVENTFNWRWFVNLLKNDLELGDGTELTVITDMQKVTYILLNVLFKSVNLFILLTVYLLYVIGT
uniref:MULE transposase domain-containing protein n=1 Tax=Nicotiana tabacum TaxID=4097 RepID=A0A1S4C5N6_TOBAC|nr:PREDICTED: uncharacterized protein LOC107815431 [Nicotiana tabacum]